MDFDSGQPNGQDPANVTNSPSVADSAQPEDVAAVSSDLQDAQDLEDPETAPEQSDDEPENAQIEDLAVVRDQDELEQAIGRQADQLLTQQADERDNKRLEKTQVSINRVRNEIRRLKENAQRALGSTKARLVVDIQSKESSLDELHQEVERIQARIHERKLSLKNEDADNAGNTRRPGESKRDFLIRTGKITPFSNMASRQGPATDDLEAVMQDDDEAEDGEIASEDDNDGQEVAKSKNMSHQNLKMPGFIDSEPASTASSPRPASHHPRKRRRVDRPILSHASDDEVIDASGDEFKLEGGDKELYKDFDSGSDSDMALTVQETEEEEARRKRKAQGFKRKSRVADDSDAAEVEDLRGIDDGDEKLYQARLKKWIHDRSAARWNAQKDHDDAEDDDEQEWFKPHPTRNDTILDGGLRIPGDIYPSLFDYQKTGVRWLWELYTQQNGGIIGDEMGLGKTIQVISFLAALHHSKKYSMPTIVVTPATVMKQWVNEFHRWWPPLRVSILHSSGSGMMDLGRESRIEDELDYKSSKSASKSSMRAAKKIVDRVIQEGHVLVTTYSGLQSYAPLLIPVEWGYAILDEGHKIRNPNTSITIHCKELRTPHRIILSGTPMQNNLVELWSLFDFIFPLRLGNLVNFRNQFEVPIRLGGYANASNLAVETALQCAQVLKDTISPYLLQRLKIDVAADLPKKTEQVLLCKLTKLQREAYERFLQSGEMKAITEGKRQMLFGIDILRKICNHPDLVHHQKLSHKEGYTYGAKAKSGKMKVLQSLLMRFRENGHKTLLFAQHRIMLDILEVLVKSLPNFNYRRMDGNTQIKDRQNMVDEFNRNPDLHVFLLTTKVGGLGINLTGADRVIIYDPDWNPSTDVQARERAWRLGQKREVEIYRLITAGTIEEKIYHRQIFKQFLTNKILRDPKQRQTFQMKDLQDLFTLGDADDMETETGALFKGASVELNGESVENGQSNGHAHDDLTDIKGIAGQMALKEADQNDSGASEEGQSNQNSNNSGSRLLSSIFSRSDVHSAIDHDAIIGGNSAKSKLTADPAFIAAEAKKVAAQAARDLQRLREAAEPVPIGTPTWTGTHGSAGRLDARGGSSARGRGSGRGGPSSASILSNLQTRQATSRTSNRSSESKEKPRGRDFLEMIHKFIIDHGGIVAGQTLIEHFNHYCDSPQRAAEFKEMLLQIAVQEKRADSGPARRRGRGISRTVPGSTRSRWVLKRSWGGTADG